MCLIPFLRLAIDHIDEILFRKILIGIFCMYITLPVIVRLLLQMTVNIDPLTFNGGYSSIWLCILYLFGTYVRKYIDYRKISRKSCLLCFAVMIIVTFLSKIGLEKAGNLGCANLLVDYTSPTIFIGSLALLLLFVNVDVKDLRIKPLIIALSNATLGVYLIHDNNLIRSMIISYLFVNELNHQAYKLALVKLVIVVVCVYLACSIIDFLRERLFGVVKRALRRLLTILY